MKTLSSKHRIAIEKEIKMLLHAHRDCLRNQGKDTLNISFNCNDGYYGEAFGILRTLAIMGYGSFGAVNREDTLNYWFSKLQTEVLEEEGFNTNHQCEHCYEKYGKDDVRNRRR